MFIKIIYSSITYLYSGSWFQWCPWDNHSTRRKMNLDMFFHSDRGDYRLQWIMDKWYIYIYNYILNIYYDHI